MVVVYGRSLPDEGVHHNGTMVLRANMRIRWEMASVCASIGGSKEIAFPIRLSSFMTFP